MNKRTWMAGFLFMAGIGAAPGEPLAVFEAREALNRDWPRTLVTYEVKAGKGRAFRPGEVKLVEASSGAETPFQFWRVATNRQGFLESGRLSFFASLGSNGAYRLELQPAAPGTPAPAAAPAAQRSADGLVLDNGLVALRLPPEGEVVLPQPLPLGHPDLSAPLRGIRLADGRWAGGSRFEADAGSAPPLATAIRCAVAEQGPLFTEAVVTYFFTNGFYRLTARVLAGDPAVRLDEQFDFGEPGGMLDWRLVVSLGKGWAPDSVYWYGPRLDAKHSPFESALAALGLTNEPPHGSRGLDFTQPGELFPVAVRYPWAPNAFYAGLTRAAEPGKAFLGMVPLHAGNWRGATDTRDGVVIITAQGDVELHWRLRASPHPKTLLHTGEYDPALPLTVCRRQWALVGGPFQSPARLHALRATEGFVTLDDYKDWILEWPEDRDVTYPRLVFSRRDVERMKGRLDALPGADLLKTFLYFNENDKRREELWNRLTADSEWSGPYGQARAALGRGDPPLMPWAAHYRQTQMAGWAGSMDELLASARLEPERRRRLRRDLAALCHTLAEPDVNPRGAMTHLGNPNMPINRFMALAFAAALIPDHPEAKRWMDVSAQYLRYKLAMNTGQGGAWSELITYFGASAPHIMQAAAVLAASGRGDESTARLSAMPALFTLRLLAPPDPRFGGARPLPNWGHEGADTLTHWLVAAANLRRIDPALAADFAWAWDRQGRPMNQHHDAGFSERVVAHAERLAGLPSNHVPAALTSAWLPGFGAVLRAHAGDPDETFFSLRQGFFVSHSDPNQGDFILYSKGAPLVALSLHAYPLDQVPAIGDLFKTFGWHSRVRFGERGNGGGWPGGGAEGGIPVHAFTASADYLRAEGDYPPQRWTRQVLFLKGKKAAGPNYLLLRDSFRPAGGTNGAALQPAWWALRTPGEKSRVTALGQAGFDYASPWGPRLQVRFLQSGMPAVESRDVSYDAPLYFGSAENWVRGSGAPAKPGSSLQVSETTTVNVAGPVEAGRDILTALAPLKAGEAGPVFERLGEGAVKAVTEEGTDYLFLGCEPFRFAQGEVAFEGVAGAVRVYPDEVHLVLSEGTGSVSYKGAVLAGAAPAVRVVPASKLGKPVRYEAPAPRQRLKGSPLPEGFRVRGDVRCEAVVAGDRITGRSEGNGGFLHAPMPAGMKVLPMLVVDGQTFAPGTSGNELIIPLMPGRHEFEVRPLAQPDIFRNWQAW